MTLEEMYDDEYLIIGDGSEEVPTDLIGQVICGFAFDAGRAIRAAYQEGFDDGYHETR